MASDNTNTINQREIWDEYELPLLRSKIKIAIKGLYNHKRYTSSDNIVAEVLLQLEIRELV